MDAIARHPENGADCRLCQSGPASWCGSCWVEAVASYREEMRELGHRIHTWDDPPRTHQVIVP